VKPARSSDPVYICHPGRLHAGLDCDAECARGEADLVRFVPSYFPQSP
jgi:hypothetical protein